MTKRKKITEKQHYDLRNAACTHSFLSGFIKALTFADGLGPAEIAEKLENYRGLQAQAGRELDEILKEVY